MRTAVDARAGHVREPHQIVITEALGRVAYGSKGRQQMDIGDEQAYTALDIRSLNPTRIGKS